MQLYEPLTKSGIIDRINKTCNTTNQSYSNVDKIANIHDGLDHYFDLAANSAPQGTFDDSGNTSAPIETQNLVSGTNSYKLTDFTNEVLHILKLSVLDSNGYEYDLVYQPFESVEDFLQEYPAAVSGVANYWTKIGDYIYLDVTPDYNATNGLRAYVNRVLSKFSFVTCTITEANPGVVTATAHGLSNSDAILLFTDGALPTNLTADSTIYYVSGKTDDTFKLSTTPSDVGATEVNTTGSVESGTHKFVKVNASPGIPSIHHKFLNYYASDQFMDEQHPKFQKNRADLVRIERDIQDYWQAMIRPDKTIINTKRIAYK